MKMVKEVETSLPRWVPLDEEWPPMCQDILYTDGKHIYYGWLETYEPLEEPCFVAKTFGRRENASPEGITHWMRLPGLPDRI
jgi:hypothetical protein